MPKRLLAGGAAAGWQACSAQGQLGHRVRRKQQQHSKGSSRCTCRRRCAGLCWRRPAGESATGRELPSQLQLGSLQLRCLELQI